MVGADQCHRGVTDQCHRGVMEEMPVKVEPGAGPCWVGGRHALVAKNVRHKFVSAARTWLSAESMHTDPRHSNQCH